MKSPKTKQLIPAAVAAGLTAIPIVTMAHMLTAAPGSSFAGKVSNTASATPTAVPTSPPTGTPEPRPVAAKSKKPEVSKKKLSVHSTTASKSAAAKTYWGTAVADQFGTVQAEVRVRGKKITAVWVTSPMNDTHSQQINEWAVPILRSETLQAQSANINAVSGASETTDAYIQSLQSALSQLGF